MSSTLTDPMVGRLVDGRYEVTARIARGGMATVYLAVDRRLDRQVALKIMHPHLAEGADVLARFRREARAAARLAHPGVVGVFDQGSDGETSYLTLEYVDGTNLRRVLRSAGALPLGRALDITEAVLDALAAAHRADLVHRDVKPENVLVATDGRIKVADFGLARAVTEATAASTGALLGTVAYLSPEIVASGVADARADVYAVGVLLYEMLTGHQPFDGETPIQVAYKHVHENIPDASEDVPWLPIEVDELIATLTARDVDVRPADAGVALDLVRRVHQEFDAETLTIRADVTPNPVPGIVGELEIESDATRAVHVGHHSGTISLPIGAVAPQEADESTARIDVPRRKRRRRRIAALVAALLVLVTMGGGAWWYFALGPGALIAVPAATGLTEADALTLIEGQGLRPTTQEAFHDTVPAGTVISTDPAAGVELTRDGDVSVLVSAGIEMLTVPDVADLTEDAAIAAIATAGLTVADTIDRPWSADVPEGTAMGTAPGAGDSIPHNEPVTLTVSAGREPITVPNVEGAEQRTAEADLTEAGAVSQLGPAEYSDTVAEGRVISQSTSGAGFRGDVVRIVVSLGPELFEVPDVFGRQFGAAEETLSDLGFEVQRENVLGGLFGTVHSQSVEAGAMMPRGTVIVLTVV